MESLLPGPRETRDPRHPPEGPGRPAPGPRSRRMHACPAARRKSRRPTTPPTTTAGTTTRGPASPHGRSSAGRRPSPWRRPSSLLEHPVRNVLDVGCGEAPWRGALLGLRPRLRYTGVDPSAWAAKRWGESRGVLHGGLSDLESLPLRGPFDLVVCSDVLHYVTDAELRRGVAAMAALARGLLWLEAFTSEDDFEGDVEGFRPRPARWYRAAFRRAGLVPLGLWLHASPAVAPASRRWRRGG